MADEKSLRHPIGDFQLVRYSVLNTNVRGSPFQVVIHKEHQGSSIQRQVHSLSLAAHNAVPKHIRKGGEIKSTVPLKFYPRLHVNLSKLSES